MSAASASGTNATTEDWLSSLFGNNVSGMAGSVARYAGIGGSTATSLLSMSAPLVLTYLGRWMRSDNLGATELAEQLRGRRSQLAAALPPGFEVPASIRATAPVATYVPPKSETTSVNVPMLILMGMLGLGGLLWWGVRAVSPTCADGNRDWRVDTRRHIGNDERNGDASAAGKRDAELRAWRSRRRAVDVPGVAGQGKEFVRGGSIRYGIDVADTASTGAAPQRGGDSERVSEGEGHGRGALRQRQ